MAAPFVPVNPLAPLIKPVVLLMLLIIAGAVVLRLVLEAPVSLLRVILGGKLYRGRRRSPLPQIAGRQGIPDAGGGYFLKPSIATRGELAFLPALQIAVGQSCQIVCSVRLADVFGVEQGHPQFQSLLNQICKKHVDFVLCQTGTLRPLVLIELDDPTHGQPRRIRRDKLVDSIAAGAGIPILHFRTAQAYDPLEVREQVAGVWAAAVAAPPEMPLAK